MKMLARVALLLSSFFALGSLGPAYAAGPVLAYPSPAYLDGTEQLMLMQTGGWKIISFNQLKAWAAGQSIPPLSLGPTGHTLGYPNVSTLDGTEQFLIYRNGGWNAYGYSQLRSWLIGNGTAAQIINPAYPSLGYPSVASVDGSEQFLLFQDGRWEDCTFAQLQTWAGLSGGGGVTGTSLDFGDPNNSAFIL